MRKINRAYKNETSALLNTANSASTKVTKNTTITHVNLTVCASLAATVSSTAVNKLAWWNAIKFSLTHSGAFGKLFDTMPLSELAAYCQSQGGAVEYNPPSAGDAIAETVAFRASIPIGAIDIQGKEQIDLLLEWPLEAGTASVKSNSIVYMSTANLGVNAEQGAYELRREAVILSSSGPVPYNINDPDVTDVWIFDPLLYVDSVTQAEMDIDATREDLLVSSYSDQDYSSSASTQLPTTTELNTPAIFLLTLIERDLTEAAHYHNLTFNITGASSTGTVLVLSRKLRQVPERMIMSHRKASEKAVIVQKSFEEKKPLIHATLTSLGHR